MFDLSKLLVYILLSPVIGALVLLLISSTKDKNSKLCALFFSGLSFTGSLLLWGLFKKSKNSFQFVVKLYWFSYLNINITLGVDGISVFFLLLTTLLVPLCILASWGSVQFHLREFLILFLLLEFFLIGAFCVLDLVLFYVFFESVLIPMFLIIVIWGSRDRKILAAYYFFLYTLLGSVIMLLSVLYVYCQVGTTDYEALLTFSFSVLEQKFLWLAFFFAFAGKVPMLPVHLWLPEAHVEAPTGGSVILAGVLLKLGTYGFLRFSLPLFPEASCFFAPLVYMMAVVGVVYSSLTAIRQTDFKRIIAYTSVAHMNLVLLGVFSFNIEGIEGAILQSISHGFVASGLFLIIGVVYERYQTRIIYYYGGLAGLMPVYTVVFLFFTVANISFPGTSSFVGEFLILVGSFKVNTSVTFIGATSVIIGGSYSLWLFNRVVFGNFKIQHTKKFLDINLKELMLFMPLMLGVIYLGICPNILLSSIHTDVRTLLTLVEGPEWASVEKSSDEFKEVKKECSQSLQKRNSMTIRWFKTFESSIEHQLQELEKESLKRVLDAENKSKLRK